MNENEKSISKQVNQNEFINESISHCEASQKEITASSLSSNQKGVYEKIGKDIRERVILHSDCNCFYASVECLYNPDIRNKPVVVSGNPENRHGIILTKNEIAKKYGIKTGEPIWQAKNKCPELITVEPHFDLYKRFSKMTREIYSDYSDRIEGFGLDEAWIDVTDSERFIGKGENIAREINQRVKQELGITVSIGVSFNKIFSKFGSDYKKPDAVTVINKENYRNIVWKSPAQDLLYVGRATKKKMNSLGIYTIGEIANTPIETLRYNFGKWGDVLWAFANGYDTSPVSKINEQNTVKSIGNSTTTPRDLNNFEDVKSVMTVLCDSVCRRLRSNGFKAKTLQITIRDKFLMSFNRQMTFDTPTNITKQITENALSLFYRSYSWSAPIRSLGIALSDFSEDNMPYQISFFNDEKKKHKLESLDKTIDILKGRFGNYSLMTANLLKDPKLSHFNPYDDHTVHPVGFF